MPDDHVAYWLSFQDGDEVPVYTTGTASPVMEVGDARVGTDSASLSSLRRYRLRALWAVWLLEDIATGHCWLGGRDEVCVRAINGDPYDVVAREAKHVAHSAHK